jgi:hypothetical protein
VKHIDSIGEFCDINHSESAEFILNADLSHALTDGVHRLPMVWITAMLHQVELETGGFGPMIDVLADMCIMLFQDIQTAKH